MKGDSSFRKYRSNRLSDTDLQEIRGVVLECLEELADRLGHNPAEFQVEYLKTSQVAALTGFTKATLESFRTKQVGPPFFKRGCNVRYRADEVREWMEANRIQ